LTRFARRYGAIAAPIYRQTASLIDDERSFPPASSLAARIRGHFATHLAAKTPVKFTSSQTKFNMIFSTDIYKYV